MVIGFIGLGIMGQPMAMNLCRAGYSLIVTDHHPEHISKVVSCGAKEGNVQEIGEQSDVVITMLPNSPQVREAVLGPDGVGQYMKKGSILIDNSSIDPTESKAIAAELSQMNVEMLDAPVSGGEPKAIDGTLSFMVGGKQEIFEQCKPILEAMGSSVVRCGEIGAGNTTKLANQIIVACNIQALAEAMTLAQKADVDPELVFQAIRGGLAGSTVMDAKAPMMLKGNDKPGFRIDLHIKDLNNALDCAHAVGAPLPMTAQVQEVLQYLHNNGCGNDDHSAIAKYYEKLADIKIGR